MGTLCEGSRCARSNQNVRPAGCPNRNSRGRMQAPEGILPLLPSRQDRTFFPTHGSLHSEKNYGSPCEKVLDAIGYSSPARTVQNAVRKFSQTFPAGKRTSIHRHGDPILHAGTILGTHYAEHSSPGISQAQLHRSGRGIVRQQRGNHQALRIQTHSLGISSRQWTICGRKARI